MAILGIRHLLTIVKQASGTAASCPQALWAIPAWEAALFSFIFDIPLLIVGLLLAVVIAALALAGLLFTRRRILPRLRIAAEDVHFSSTMVESLMVFYGLTVGLIAINVWQNYSEATQVVSQEATAIAVLYRDVSGYPPPVRTQLQNALKEYVAYVIHEAWPEQRKGHITRVGTGQISRIETILIGFEPTTQGQAILHTQTLRAFDQLIEARRMRLDAVQAALPGLMWAVIFFGAALVLTGSFFFRARSSRLHTILVTLLAMFIAMVIFVVLAFDRPFRGQLGISSEHYQLVYEQLMNR